MNNFMKEILKGIWIKITAGLILLLIAMVGTFFINTAMMMEQYKVDKAYSDKDRRELTTAIKRLNGVIGEMSKILAVNSNRILTCEKDIDRLHR